jgi:hypothetical protein
MLAYITKETSNKRRIQPVRNVNISSKARNGLAFAVVLATALKRTNE